MCLTCSAFALIHFIYSCFSGGPAAVDGFRSIGRVLRRRSIPHILSVFLWTAIPGAAICGPFGGKSASSLKFSRHLVQRAHSTVCFLFLEVGLLPGG